MRRILSVLAAMLMVGVASAAGAQEVPAPQDTLQQMPQQMPQQLPQQLPLQSPQQMPQHLPQPQFQTESPAQEFLLQCRTTNSDVIFLMNPDLGLVENVSSFPKMTGALYVSETEYMLVFTGREVPVPVEFVISRYTGRLTAVADGTSVLFTGLCRKGRARALF